MKISWKEKAIVWYQLDNTGNLFHDYWKYICVTWLPKELAEWGYDVIEYDCQVNKCFTLGRLSFQWSF